MKIESEKLLEAKLGKRIKAMGGWSIKMLSTHVWGLPDRICLLPGGRVIFAEVKTTKKKPSKVQIIVHKKLRDLGFTVLVIDRTSQIEEII